MFFISEKTGVHALVFPTLMNLTSCPLIYPLCQEVPIEQGCVKPQKKEPQTLRWLVSQYRKSSHWVSLALNSRKRLDFYFDHVIKKSGNFDYKKITSKHILLGVEDLKTKPASATQFLASMRALFKWAYKQEYIAINPCIGIENPRYKSDGFKAWTKEDMY
ncbi:hypothetical protein [Candidatus Liberibacter solanacearum]|uniref:hypothetical protein n=1 Tax=Candidatus Liberibacter solanacearum TaxID=556287 RepID=UPI001FCD26ED|nr:hypothetical protein [Candidatus Liberibacter solanacearum]